MNNLQRLSSLWKAWKLFYKEIKRNHWTKVDFPVKWAVWAIASILLTTWTAVGCGIGIIGLMYIYGTIVVFDLYLVCREPQNSFSVFCRTFSKRTQIKYVYMILSSYLLILAGITFFMLLVVQFNRAQRGVVLIFSSTYVVLMVAMILFSAVPLIFIHSKKLWRLWCGGSLGLCAGFHLIAWRNMKSPDSWMLRRSLSVEENGVLWIFLTATAAAFSLLISYWQACRFHEKTVRESEKIHIYRKN